MMINTTCEKEEKRNDSEQKPQNMKGKKYVSTKGGCVFLRDIGLMCLKV